MSRILRELEVLQGREGWLPEEGLREIAARLGVPLHRLEGLSSFYTHFRREPPPAAEISVCRDVTCRLAGAAEAQAELRASLAEAGVVLREVSCLGRCDRAPAGCVGQRPVDLRDGAEVRAALGDPEPLQRTPRSWAADPFPSAAERHVALRALLERDPRDLSRQLEESGLRGMGGAGFPTGRKWGLVAAEPADTKYVICNADESEPGTFKDRVLLATLPHLVIEGMVLAGLSVGAGQGIIFLRHEYSIEQDILETALRDARARGILGPDAAGSGQHFEIEIFISPGGYILGEETALLEALEDRRGEPRNKPPYPGQVGLFGQPT
ncbi:MAG: NAD(P)H-dependent oxidoreductase subunit E, partial [Myxococcota bacterium]